MLSIGEFARLGGVTTRTLRHYGELGILEPAKVDPTSGYRSYSVDQLADLRRVLALRELGVGLDQIRKLLVDDVSVEQLRGMLRLRQVEIADAIDEQRERLRRVEVHLDAIERGDAMRTIDVTVKRTDPLRVGITTTRAAGFGYENINPIFEESLAKVAYALVERGITLGIAVGWYEEDQANDDVIAHIGWEIGDQKLERTDLVRAEELPVIEVASMIKRGPMVDVMDDYEAMIRWVDASGYQLAGAGRELYWQLDFDQTKQVTELQLPIVRPG
jgi:DNA-binding transcriptional MerR regulator